MEVTVGMTSTRITKLLLLFALTITPLCAAQQTEDVPLQISIRQTSPELTFQVELHNTGKRPLNLEQPFENSDVHSTAGLLLTDEHSKAVFLSQRIPDCDDRITICNYVGILPAGPVWVQPGQIYSFSVELRNFNVPHTPGRYTLQVIYAHLFSVRPLPPDAPYGDKVISNSVPFTIPKP